MDFKAIKTKKMTNSIVLVVNWTGIICYCLVWTVQSPTVVSSVLFANW